MLEREKQKKHLREKPSLIVLTWRSDIERCGDKSIPHNVLIVSPTEMQQSAVIVITNYTGTVTDSSVPPTDRH